MLIILATGTVHGTAKLVLELATALMIVPSMAHSLYWVQHDVPAAERRTFHSWLVLMAVATGAMYLDDFGIVTGDRHGFFVGFAGAIYVVTLAYVLISAGVFRLGRKAATD